MRSTCERGPEIVALEKSQMGWRTFAGRSEKRVQQLAEAIDIAGKATCSEEQGPAGELETSCNTAKRQVIAIETQCQLDSQVMRSGRCRQSSRQNCSLNAKLPQA